MTGEGTHRWEAAHFCKDDVGLAAKGAQVSLEANAHVVRSPAQRVGEGQLTTQDSFEDMEDTGDSCIIDPHRVRRKLGEPHMRVEEGRPEHSCGGPVVVAHILCPAVAARASGHRATDGCDDDWVGLAVTRQPPLQPLKCVHGSRRPSQLDATLDEWGGQRRAAGCAHVRRRVVLHVARFVAGLAHVLAARDEIDPVSSVTRSPAPGRVVQRRSVGDDGPLQAAQECAVLGHG